MLHHRKLLANNCRSINNLVGRFLSAAASFHLQILGDFYC